MVKQGLCFAPAKINLGLRITGRYPNGYHRLETIFVPITLYDRLSIQENSVDTIKHFWPEGTPVDMLRKLAYGTKRNPLLKRTLTFLRGYLRTALGSELGHFSVRVHKRVPSPSGLGGASSDAAALIAKLLLKLTDKDTQLWKSIAINDGNFYERKQLILRRYSVEFLAELTKLGADIPYFLQFGLVGQAARLEGIGHELTAVNLPPLSGWICVPDFGFSTEKMFAEVRKWKLPAAEILNASQAAQFKSNLALRLEEIPYSDEPVSGVKVVLNDFDTVAQTVLPSESQILTKAKTCLAKMVQHFLPGNWIVGMTGSGAALFAASTSGIPRARLTLLSPVLRARLGKGWQVLPFQSYAVNPVAMDD